MIFQRGNCTETIQWHPATGQISGTLLQDNSVGKLMSRRHIMRWYGYFLARCYLNVKEQGFVAMFYKYRESTLHGTPPDQDKSY